MELDPLAVSLFAQKGIALTAVTKRDFCWAHDPYMRNEPPRKDLEIRIRETDYMGPIVHRVTVPNVHFEEAHAVTEKVLAEYKASFAQHADELPTTSPRM